MTDAEINKRAAKESKKLHPTDMAACKVSFDKMVSRAKWVRTKYG